MASIIHLKNYFHIHKADSGSCNALHFTKQFYSHPRFTEEDTEAQEGTVTSTPKFPDCDVSYSPQITLDHRYLIINAKYFFIGKKLTWTGLDKADTYNRPTHTAPQNVAPSHLPTLPPPKSPGGQKLT